METTTPKTQAEAQSPESPGAAIELTGVAHSFGDLEALAGVELNVAPGEVVAIVGASGCGKSTLLELIAGLAEPSTGSIAVGGERDAAARLDACAWMPQRDLLLPWRLAVDNAALGLRLAGIGRAEARERAGGMLERLGVGEFARSHPRQLSGGMRQRVAFARTLLTGKPVLLLDEPLAALDAITRAELQELLVETLAAERRTTVLVTHDVEEAFFVADRVLLLSPRPGRVVWSAASPVDRSEPRASAVTAPAFAAVREAALEALAEGRG
ncbi:MAG: ABC transporter ATP-binding protein [Thermoleophilales bacterium]|nr:ABC transporter ATP-binding protein [Thermoleophilales bacterium]